jgi:hypothetical protein
MEYYQISTIFLHNIFLEILEKINFLKLNFNIISENNIISVELAKVLTRVYIYIYIYRP